MSSLDVQTQPEQDQGEQQDLTWSLATRVAFRFCFLYFGLYCLSTQIITSLVVSAIYELPDPSSVFPLKQIITWTAAHVFHVKTQLVFTGSGSGDKTVDWVQAFCLFIFAVAATCLWFFLDRDRANYVALHKWFRLFLRFSLAGQMLSYGLAKAVPLQMPFPYLSRLIEPFGNFSPMGVLWSSIGASPAYEVFAGCAELLGGLLLIFPRTTLFGALVCLADMTQVFMLNMAYDVPVKLFSFHLILMSVLLLAPDFQRLANVFFLDRAATPSMQPQLFLSQKANRIGLVVQVIFGIWLVATNVYGSWSAWRIYGGARPKSPLYGIWDVEQLSIDGQVRPALLGDNERWHRVIFDSPMFATIQSMNDSFACYGVAIEAEKRSLALTKNFDKNWSANLSFQRDGQDQMTLDGEMNSHKMHAVLKLVDRNKFLVVSRGFHWVQEYPFNR
jgi:uncharacterized membrane protein YphA (DoxX/SURF4 family)